MKIVARASEENRHKEDIESVIVSGDKVFSAADDGYVKIWSKSDLSLVHQFKAHDYAVNHMLIFNGSLYTASMDQTIKVWQMDTWTLQNTLTGHDDTPKRLVTNGKNVFSGDEKGEVFKWDASGNILQRTEVIEEVWDLHVMGNRIYSIRDRGLTVTETIEDSKQHNAICIIEGRAPIKITEKDILICNRSGTSVLHFSNTPSKCEYQQEFEGEHNMIITILGIFEDFLLSGGFDEKLVLWSLDKGSMISSIKLPGCPAAIAISKGDKSVYIGGTDGYLVKLDISSSS